MSLEKLKECLVQVKYTPKGQETRYLDAIMGFRTTDDHVILYLPRLKVAIPWIDLEQILMELGQVRGKRTPQDLVSELSRP